MHAPPVHGNFRRYYGMRSARAAQAASVDRMDERVAALLKWYNSQRGDVRAPERVLDVGCNAAKPLIELCQHADPPLERAVGVDIDPVLVSDAKAAVRAAWSQMQPDVPGSQEGAADYFPACFATHLGPLALPPGPARGFPKCIALYEADWVTHDCAPLAHEDALGYDLILCFSLTKWIHLNQGDGGLVRFLHRLCACLRPGGILALEVQPWRSYDQARSVSRDLRQAYAALRLYPDDMEYVLGVFGLIPLGPVAVGTGYGFRRPVLLYQQPAPAPTLLPPPHPGSLGWPWAPRNPKIS
ncbi:uncharacterized protein MJAP1_001155 [Malassezia japonica]|uniref:RNA methyltransferase n=1 Tax=Malassezia japonica TaxID=223818 RepID=A0AAF0F0G8_9BASI|nr:uncharacterized protein MJAP1_001155 [Malassezia japonica]WFD38207.1 hypothetical protein MJAP1_001155 [Malassezia japonica]